MLILFKSFGNVDLDLSVHQVYIESSVHSYAVWGRIENVADHLAIAEWMIADKFTNRLIDSISQQD